MDIYTHTHIYVCTVCHSAPFYSELYPYKVKFIIPFGCIVALKKASLSLVVLSGMCL